MRRRRDVVTSGRSLVAKARRRAGVDLLAIGVLGALQVGVMLANLVRVKVVALESGPAGVGLLTVIEQIVLLIALACTMSMPFAAVKFLSAAHAEGRRPFARSYIAFRRMLTGLSFAGLGAALVVAVAAPGVFGSDVEERQDVLLVALAGVPLLNLLALQIRGLAASGRSRAAGGLTLAQAVGVAAGGGVGVVVGGVRGYFAGGAVGLALVLAGGTLYLRRTERIPDHGEPVRTLPVLRGHPGVLRFALVHSVIMLTTPMAYLIARYAVLDDAGLDEVGLLAAAFAVSQALTLLLTPATALFLTPSLNRGEPGPAKLRRMLEFRRAILLVITVAMLPLVLFPRQLVELLFAPEFTPVSGYVYLFVAGEALVLVSAIHQALLIAVDDFGVNVVFIVAGQVVMTVLVLALVPAMGIPGVGVALIADHALVLGLTTWRLSRHHGMQVLDGLARFVPLMLAVVGAGAVVAAADADADAGGLALVKLALLIGLAAAALALHRATAPARGEA